MPISIDTLNSLARYDFPGNVRELENLLERAMVLGAASRAVELTIPSLPIRAEVAHDPILREIPIDGGFRVLHDLTDRLEADLIRRALKMWPHDSNTELAEKLGTNRRVLELRMKEHGIDKRHI